MRIYKCKYTRSPNPNEDAPKIEIEAGSPWGAAVAYMDRCAILSRGYIQLTEGGETITIKGVDFIQAVYDAYRENLTEGGGS